MRSISSPRAVSKMMGRSDSSGSPGKIASVPVGEHDIEQHDVGLGRARSRRRFLDGAGDLGLETLAREVGGQRLRDRGLVFDE